EVGEREVLVRAVCTDKYDKDKGTIAPSLMMGPDTSVSRSPLIPLHDHWEIFRRCVQKPEKERLLELIGTIGVSRLRKVAEEHDTAEGSKHEVKPGIVIRQERVPALAEGRMAMRNAGRPPTG